MTTVSMLALLQAAASLLVSAQDPQTTLIAMQKAVNLGSNAVQTVVQARAEINFTVKKNNGVWPNMENVLNAPYLDANNNFVRLGQNISLAEEYTSFGDINNDGIDDAAVIVNKQGTGGAPHYFLAAMLNHDNILFNIADFSLGNSVNINSHNITGGKIIIDNVKYELLGKEIRKVL